MKKKKRESNRHLESIGIVACCALIHSRLLCCRRPLLLLWTTRLQKRTANFPNFFRPKIRIDKCVCMEKSFLFNLGSRLRLAEVKVWRRCCCCVVVLRVFEYWAAIKVPDVLEQMKLFFYWSKRFETKVAVKIWKNIENWSSEFKGKLTNKIFIKLEWASKIFWETKVTIFNSTKVSALKTKVENRIYLKSELINKICSENWSWKQDLFENWSFAQNLFWKLMLKARFNEKLKLNTKFVLKTKV